MLDAKRRPFFLCAAFWAATAMTVWIAALTGNLALEGVVAGISWHSHEMIFGFAGAVIGGFLLTAVPNWTGRPALTGWPLAGLVTIWAIGRLSTVIPVAEDASVWDSAAPGAVAAANLAFPVLLLFFIGFELIQARYRRGIIVFGLVLLWALAHAGFYLELFIEGYPSISVRGGLAALVMLITLIGGRIVPAFTKNWLSARDAPDLPAPFGTLDKLAMAAAFFGLAAWVLLPGSIATSLLCTVAAALLFIRLSRWAGFAVFSEPMLFVLHLGYGLLAAGFAAMAVAVLDWGLLTTSIAIHIWTVGAVGTMTTAVMIRAMLGHAGLPIQADRQIAVIFGFLAIALAARVAADVWDGSATLIVSGLAWSAAFLLFLFRFHKIGQVKE